MDSSTLIDEFTKAVDSAGLPAPATIRADGQLHRFATNGKSGDDSGWYVLFDAGAGAFGCWRSGINQKWSTAATKTLSRDDKAALKRRMREAAKRGRQERERKQAEAAEIAKAAWREAKPAPADHPYLVKKQVKPNGLRIDDDGQLLVPMAVDGALVSLQVIDADGDKCFIPGGRTAGASCTLGTVGETVYIAEGFATAATIREATGEAVVVAFNAGNLKAVAKSARAKYPDTEIVIAADNDCAGSANVGADAATAAAGAVGAHVVVPELDGHKCDFNDVAVQRGADAVREQLAASAETAPQKTIQPDDDDVKKSAATCLVEMAEELYRLGQSNDGESYAVPTSGPKIVCMLRGNRGSLRGQLARVYFKRYGRVAPQQALADALAVMDGMAAEADPQPLYLRVASFNNETWLDLGGNDGRAVRIANGAWTVEAEPPVLFKRTALNAAMPEPQAGELDELWRFMNVAEADRPLLAAWLVAVLQDEIAHPVLSLFGEQGTGKTTAQRLLVDLIDPSPVPTRKPPRDPDSWVTAAAGSWVVGMDNLSDVKPWLSDSICRAVTGDGDVRRKLYTDGDHAVFAYRRCIILNSIDLGGTRGDLAERMLPINLEMISESERIGERDIWPRWYECRPRVLGGLLTLAASYASHASQNLDQRLETLPRMADFAVILAGVDTVLNTDGLAQFLEKQRNLATDALSTDPLIAAIEHCITATFEGTAAELLDQVAPDKAPKGFPGNARAVTQRLNRNAPSMRKAGWHVSHDSGENHRNTTTWMLIPPTRPEKARKTPSHDSRNSQIDRTASHASHASQEYRPTKDDGRETLTI